MNVTVLTKKKLKFNYKIGTFTYDRCKFKPQTIFGSKPKSSYTALIAHSA